MNPDNSRDPDNSQYKCEFDFDNPGFDTSSDPLTDASLGTTKMYKIYKGTRIYIRYNCFKIVINLHNNQGLIEMIWNDPNYNGTYIEMFKSDIKGMGKYILCMAVSIGISENLIKSDKVYLEAVSLKKKNYSNESLSPEDLYNQIEQSGLLLDLSTFAPMLPKKLKEYIYTGPNQRILVQNKFNDLLELNKLTKYYSLYGFKSLYKYPKRFLRAGQHMVAELSDIATFCNL
jgi:hypothetical protein